MSSSRPAETHRRGASGAALRRREFLLGAALAGIAPSIRAFARTPPDTAAADLDRLLDGFLQDKLRRSPEDATTLGLDKGQFAGAKSRLDDRSLEAIRQDRSDTAARLQRLSGIDRTALVGQPAVSYDTVAYALEAEDDANRQFAHISARPYVLSQMDGAYQSVPDFLDTKHRIESKEDADAYLARLEAFSFALDQETERLRYDSARGVVPPDFILKTSLKQLSDMANTAAEDSVLVKSLVRRTKERGITGDYVVPATRVYNDRIVRALDRQATAVAVARAAATDEAGIWKLRNGEAGYAALLKLNTTTSMNPDEIHRLGLDRAGQISARLDEPLRGQGLTQGTVGQRLRAMYDPKYFYPDTDDGRSQLLADLTSRLKEVRARLPTWFKTLPKADVTLVRVPPAIERGAPAAYYAPPSLDGARPGICYFNLYRITDWPKWRPAWIMYHESIPGHHLQNALALEKPDLPVFIKALWLAAYGEGWALYAEQLADEMGLYEGDSLSQIGYLQADLMRAGRLVTDTGIHAKRWSRERAIQYFVDLMGFSSAGAAAEIDRYCVSPGQACSYMIGKITWLGLRERARQRLGPRFDIGAFHDAALLSGPLPLAVFDRVIDDYLRDAAN
jgi:uncharacterized protein (DUF885 family)